MNSDPFQTYKILDMVKCRSGHSLVLFFFFFQFRGGRIIRNALLKSYLTVLSFFDIITQNWEGLLTR